MCEKIVQRPRFTIVSSVYYGRQEIAQFSTILICKILLTQPVPQAGLNTPPAGVYSNQEYLKYSGFEYPSVGGKHLFSCFPPTEHNSNQEYFKYSGFEYTSVGRQLKPVYRTDCDSKIMQVSIVAN